MKRIVFFVATLLALTSCKEKSLITTNTENGGWVLMYRNDDNGNSMFGDKDQLIEAVRNGLPVRIGFGSRGSTDSTKSIEHVTNAHFLTISNGKEVFAQIEPIIGQYPVLENDSLSITFRQNINWSIIVGTNGFSDRLSTDYLTDTIIGNRTRATEVSWFVRSSQNKNIDDFKTRPLYSEK